MKNIFELSEEEKNRIRGLHESFKNTHGGLIIEQDTNTGTTKVVATDENSSFWKSFKFCLTHKSYVFNIIFFE